jgi:hypothetical protein
MVYRLSPGEVLLHTQHLDPEKATCVSTTLDPLLPTGFPLGPTGFIYLHVIKRRVVAQRHQGGAEGGLGVAARMRRA